MKLVIWRAVLLTLSLAVMAPAQQPGGQYKVQKRVTVGGEGGWDYLTVDSDTHRLFITRGTHVMVLDSESLKPVGDIPNLQGIHGVALVPETGHGYVSNGGNSTVTVFDLKSLQATGTVQVGNRPDAIAYDPVSKRVFTFNAAGHDTTAIDTSNNSVVGSLPLGGKPEFSVADGRGHMYVNIEDKSELVMFDSKTLKEMGRWPLKPCEEPSGLAIDQQHRRLFAGCSNEMMAVIDGDSGKVVTTVPIGRGVDANAFDPATQLAFSSNGGSGTLTVVHEDSPDKYSVAQNVETARGARTMALDKVTHKIYLVTAQFGPPPAATPDRPHPRASIVPGTFEVLEVGR
jgi:YVTN family beta-propeller protein